MDINLENDSVCIVASTLPAAFINKNIEIFKITKIIVLSETLGLSYQVLKLKNPSLKISIVPRGFFAKISYFFYQLFWIRLTNRRIIFFHECCLGFLDLLINFIKPSGFFVPIVSMSGFEKIEFSQFPKGKLTRFIGFFGLVSKFIFYRSPSIGGCLPEYVMSIKQYHGGVVQYSYGFSSDTSVKSGSNEIENSKKILFLTGKTFLADRIQIDYFSMLIATARAAGYTCYIKDHPNPIYRLNLKSDEVNLIDPLIPSELLGIDFHLVFGVSTSGLLSYDDRAVSLINMMVEMSADDRLLCISHFNDAAPNNKIRYINDFNEFKTIL